MPKQNEPLTIDEIRRMKGLDKIVHKSLEDVVKSITRNNGICITLKETNIDVE